MTAPLDPSSPEGAPATGDLLEGGEGAPATGDLLRGPEGGYARAHPGLAAFYEDVARDIADGPPGDGAEALHADLNEWLAMGGPRALLRGPVTAEHRRLLARWALSLAEGRAAAVVYVPVDRAFGTALERDMLALLFGQFRDASAAVFGRPRSAEELKLAVRMALSGVGMVSSFPTEEAPHLILILDGIDQAADGWQDQKSSFLAEPGEGAHVLVTISGRDPSWSAEQACARLGWHVEETAVFESEIFEDPPSDAGGQTRDEIEAVVGIQGIRALDGLSAALAPVSSSDLVTALGLSDGEAAALSGDAVSGLSIVVRRADGEWHFRDAAARAAWADPDRASSLEDALIERGLGRLAAGAPGAPEWPAYLVENLGAHVERRCSDPGLRMALVAPAWLDAWLCRPAGLLGFVTDVRRARRAAEAALLDACARADEGRRAALLAFVIRCALVEGSLFAKEGSREEEAYRSAPFKGSGVDLSAPTGAARARAEVLATFAAHLSGEDRSHVRALLAAWIDESPDLADVEPIAVPEVSFAREDVDPERGRRLREGETHESMDGYLSRDVRIRGSGLSPEEAYRLASSREGEPRMIAFAGVLPDLAEERREEAVREVVCAYSEHGDRLAMRVLAACGPNMSLEDAAKIVSSAIFNDWTDSLAGTLSGFGGLAEMTPLLLRIAGSSGLVAIAKEIACVGEWLS